MLIGVFDSGVGGLSVANAIEDAFPEHEILYCQDKESLPYGTKTPDQLMKLVYPILNKMQDQGCKVIVIACNSVSTTIIDYIRAALNVPVVGVEPLLKTASKLTKSNVIAVCATPTTLSSDRYAVLLKEHTQNIAVLEPDCSEWAYMIEQDQIDRGIIRSHITNVCEQNADVIVLGCTHYHWIEKDIRSVADKYSTEVIQPENDIIERLKLTISRLG